MDHDYGRVALRMSQPEKGGRESNITLLYFVLRNADPFSLFSHRRWLWVA